MSTSGSIMGFDPWLNSAAISYGAFPGEALTYDLAEPSPEAVEAQSGVESWSTTPGFDEADAEELRVWSGALPAIINAPARPWNGRQLTERERLNARWVYITEGAQAAYEWLSEHAR
jgi:hypothetical protein